MKYLPGNIVKIKIVMPIAKLLKQGMTSEKLALTVALGVTLGIFPVIGSTTLLCTLAVFLLGLNLPAIQAVNYITYPLQLILLIPFYKTGNFLLGSGAINLTPLSVLELIRKDIWEAIQGLWVITIHAIFVWLLIAPLLIIIIYFMLFPIFRKVSVSYQNLSDTPTM